ANGDLAGLRGLCLRHGDAEQAVGEGRVDPVRVNELGETDGALEAAVHALSREDAHLAFGGDVEAGGLGAADGEDVLLEADVDLVRAHTRKLDVNDVRIAALGDVECRDPYARAHAVEGLVEGAVEGQHAVEGGSKSTRVQHGRSLHEDVMMSGPPPW